MNNKTQTFIDKAKAIHEDKYDYSKSKYINCDTKIIIICSQHGEFYQTPRVHLKRSGCKKCGIANRAFANKSSITEFMDRAKRIHGDKYDYSKSIYVNCDTKMIIKCDQHGDFYQTPYNHLKGKGCRKCGFITGAAQQRLTKNDFIKRAIKLHGNVYDYSHVNYKNNNSQIEIICKTHGKFMQQPNNHLVGNGCPKCGRISTTFKQTTTTDAFIQKAKQIHKEKYNYSKVDYTKAHGKVIIICNEHGEFNQSADSHLRGSGCPKCIGRLRTTDDFRLEAQIVHGNKYDYTLVQYEYATTKVIIICKTHGKFMQQPNNHLLGNGCPECGKNQTSEKLKSSTLQFIERAKSIHKESYDYAKVNYINANTKVMILCNKHGMFQQQPNNHLSGQGCPKCACVGYSKAQIDWLNLLEQIRNIKIQHIGNSAQEYRIKNTKWKADGYCKETNTIFEFHGDYWHGNPTRYDPEFVNKVCNKKMKTLYANTLKREQRIKELGYNLEVMWESDWIKINKRIILLQRAFRSK